MIPFLKNRDNSPFSQGEEEPTQRRTPDDGEEDYGIVDAIAEDMLDALQKKDKSLLKETLYALCDYIRNEDEDQDLEQMAD